MATDKSLIPLLYLVALAYGALTYFLAPALILVTLLFVGIPVLFYLAFCVAGPVVACIAGLQSARSVWYSILIGYPCALLYAIQAPLAGVEEYFGVPVPWLVEAPASFDEAKPQLALSVAVTTIVFVISFFIGIYLRHRRLRAALQEPTLADLMRDS